MKGVSWAGSKKYIPTLSLNLMERKRLRALAYIGDNIRIYLKEIRFGNMKYNYSPQPEDQLQII
jgi:hypothetical protein